MAGIIGKKLDMTRIPKDGKLIPVTLIRVPSLRVAQIKTVENDGYRAVVLEATDGKQVLLREVSATGAFEGVEAGSSVMIDIMESVTETTIVGISKGKGFAGAMKRHNFSGGPGRVGSKFHRALGSIGNRKPRRTKPGKKMHGHMGTDRITLKHVPIELVNKTLGVIGVRGPVPGARNGFIVLDF